MIPAETKEICTSIARTAVTTTLAKKTIILQFRQIPPQTYITTKQPSMDICMQETVIVTAATIMFGSNTEQPLRTAVKLPTKYKTIPETSASL